jgi:hypothetical protein
MTIIIADIDKLNDDYAKFYNPSKHLAGNEVIVLFKRTYFQAIYSEEI